MFAPPVAAMERALDSESTLSQLGFPNEFPYEFDCFTSPGDSTETEDETSDDEDDFFAGLTRRLALSTQRLPSPPPLPFFKAPELNSSESTRSGLGTCGDKSPNGPFSQAPSRPESPCLEEDSFKVISAAAGEVSKIKRANLDAKPSSRPNPNPNTFILTPQNAAYYGHYYYWLRQPALNAFPYPVRGVFPAPTAVKQPSAGTGVFTASTAVKPPSVGTGVFLPKNHRSPSVSGKKGGGGCVKLPTKVVQTQHPKIGKFPGRCNSRSQARLSTNSNIPNLSSETQFPKLQ